MEKGGNMDKGMGGDEAQIRVIFFRAFTTNHEKNRALRKGSLPRKAKLLLYEGMESAPASLVDRFIPASYGYRPHRISMIFWMTLKSKK